MIQQQLNLLKKTRYERIVLQIRCVFIEPLFRQAQGFEGVEGLVEMVAKCNWPIYSHFRLVGHFSPNNLDISNTLLDQY